MYFGSFIFYEYYLNFILELENMIGEFFYLCLKLKESEFDENLSEKDFKKVLNITLKWGFFGIHRIYVKKIFSGILYIFFVIFSFLPYLIFKVDEKKMIFFTFLVIFFVYVSYIKDLIFIVTGRFKDKEGKVIKENCFKDEILDSERISSLDLTVLLRLTMIGRRDYPNCFGIYLFYAGHFKKGLFYVVLDILSYIFLFLGFFRYMKILYVVIFVMVCQLIIYSLILYDRHLIKKERFKDKDGKIICVRRTDESYFH